MRGVRASASGTVEVSVGDTATFAGAACDRAGAGAVDGLAITNAKAASATGRSSTVALRTGEASRQNAATGPAERPEVAASGTPTGDAGAETEEDEVPP